MECRFRQSRHISEAQDSRIGDGSRGEGERRIILLRGKPSQEYASPHDDSRPISVTKTQHQVSTVERALLVGVGWKRAPRFPGMPAGEQGRESLAELVELARSAGAEIAGTVFQMRDAANPATLVGRGKLDEIRAEATAHKAPLIIFDSNLSPVQQRNIEEATERRVVDRTQLILDIFARHARSREGQLQVELAQLNYMLPRLSGKGTAMSRLGGKSGGVFPRIDADAVAVRTDGRTVYRLSGFRAKTIFEPLQSPLAVQNQ